MKSKLIKNCILLTSPNPVNLLVKNHRILKISESEITHENTEIIDLQNQWVLPGFIDLHVHGAGGGEVFKATITEFEKITSTLYDRGLYGITPTTIVDPKKDFEQLRILKDTLDGLDSNLNMFGLHLEGPHVNPVKRGGIPQESVLPYRRDDLLKIINILGNQLAMMTIASEVSPDMEIIDILLAHDIVPALGHTNISYEEAHQAFDKGIRHVTHIFNAMPAIHHRNPGPLLAILERKNISVQIIADGAHLNPAVVRYLYNNLGIDNCICISDGQSIIGLPDGEYDINGNIHVKNGDKATDKDGNLIGTALDVGKIARNFQQFTGCSQQEALQTVTINPARILGLESIFDLSVGGSNLEQLIAVDKNWRISRIL